jgi:hypothetical protein
LFVMVIGGYIWAAQKIAREQLRDSNDFEKKFLITLFPQPMPINNVPEVKK